MNVGDTVEITKGRYAGRTGVLTEISTRGSQVENPYIITLFENKNINYQVGCAENELKQTDPQDTDDTRQREASLQQTIADLQAVLFNEAGLERLANITDEDWQRAEDSDSEGEN